MRFYFRPLYALAKLYWRVRRPLTVGVKGMVFDDQNRLLLVRHTYQPGWHMPGGGVEKGETLLQSVVREVREETGIICEDGPEALQGAFSNFSEFKNDYVIVFVFKKWRRDPEFKPPRWEIEQSEFFPIDALPEGTSLATKRRLDEYFKRREHDFVW